MSKIQWTKLVKNMPHIEQINSEKSFKLLYSKEFMPAYYKLIDCYYDWALRNNIYEIKSEDYNFLYSISEKLVQEVIAECGTRDFMFNISQYWNHFIEMHNLKRKRDT